MPSFHVLIASIGRSTLQSMIDSLKGQLVACDHVTVVFDGVAAIPIDCSGASFQLHVIEQSPALGFWGHGVRNTYAKRLARTDFVLHADDDDRYTSGTFDMLRRICRNPLTLYIGKFKRSDGTIFPLGTYVKEGEIGTPCGIIPFDLNPLGTWLLRRGGDGKFYEAIARRAKRIQWLDFVLYECG
jgi:hypothetical protein